MDSRYGVPQGRLLRVKAHWGAQVREHLAMVPLFDSGYKVLGLVGLDSDALPTWYPGVPLVVERRRMVFRSSLREAPPDWSEVPPDLLEHCFFFDNWGAIQALVPKQPGAPDLRETVNLAWHRIRGRAILDVVYEPPLHRVRAIILRGRWGRKDVVPILRLPALAECLEPVRVAPLDADALGAPPQRPESWGERIVRALAQPLSPIATRKR